MAKDLKNMIDGIETSEDKVSKLEEKINRLTELTNRQKKLINDQEQMIEGYKEKITAEMDIPPDIVELKEIIGSQRAQLKEKEMEMEYFKASKAEVQKELEFLKKQSLPLEQKYSESFETIGNLNKLKALNVSDCNLNGQLPISLFNIIRSGALIAMVA